ncbi:RIB43A-like with coiled-coils protein 1 isoform X1 [Denticeps clupeoides]|uniref:RIB43A-like with coiled-coils protein 1 isoform X1 n=1 Tax=Denticeps clupeoides TaxID=299321 RepID=UPI0010A2B0AA|nr:RIB43A-like with coiled-coils protein 1 isoform X1 [Denticeps clupeoides]
MADDVTRLERRRAAEVARRGRIFDVRRRVMGVDVPALELQVSERRRREETEVGVARALDALSLSHDQMYIQKQKDEEERKAELARDLVQYRAVHQRPEDSLDADLTCDLKGASMIAFSVPEWELGPASMQVFQVCRCLIGSGGRVGGSGCRVYATLRAMQGEGLREEDSRRAQMEETARTLRAQREESAKQRRERKHEELQAEMRMVQGDQRALRLQILEAECKRAARVALSSFNRAQAEEVRERQRKGKQLKEAEDRAEIAHTVTSDLLTECPDSAVRPGQEGAAWRVLTDRWKGLTAEQRGAILREREEQRAEGERRRAIDRRRELAWDSQWQEQGRAQEEAERRSREAERERRRQMDKYNQELSLSQRRHQQFLNKRLYTNQATDHYFSQFNSSSR